MALKHAAIFTAILSACGGEGETMPSVSQWQHVGTVAGVQGYYTPVVMMGAGIRIFSNTDDGRWGYQDGTWQGVGAWTEAIVNPPGPDHFIRTSGVACDGNARCTAILHVGPCYGAGCVAGFSPQTRSSSDFGRNWAVVATNTPFGLYQSSAANLIVTEGCEAWEDGTGLRLVRMTAPLPCMEWTSDRKDMWPTDGNPQFCSAARIGHTTHMICADGFPAKRHVWICSNDAATWRVVEANAGTLHGDKGTNLVAAGGTLHALSAGVHYTTGVVSC